MTNTKNLANIAINKSRVKEYSNKTHNRIVYLNNGTEFQIELFNPYHYTIGVTISFDEKSESSELLVLKPGERYWLDRYLNKQKKFKFNTYEVEDSKEAREAIAENGKVTLKFYKEREEFPKYTVYDYDKWRYPSDGTTIRYLNSTSNGDYITNATNSINSDIICNYCCDASIDLRDNANYTIQTSASTIETGRIEEGSRSDQSFTHVNKDFEYWPFVTETIKLLPTSQKPITTEEISKRYCYNCGRKLKDKFKFCPFCGTKQ